ncbi:MAG: glycosyltransferase family 39 protein [bacterium]|nr:glycosyltransferase family 39 protein [bacterium]
MPCPTCSRRRPQRHRRKVLHPDRHRSLQQKAAFPTSSLVTIFKALWLLGLLLYSLAGASLVPFHPDEGEHIRMSRDFVTAFIDRQPQTLAVRIESTTGRPATPEETLRLINAPLHGYVMGLAWNLRGLTVDQLPPLWNWGADYATNLAEGRRPSEAMLSAARGASAVFLWLSSVLVFALGKRSGGEVAAFIASGLYITNPLVLFHARRAMHEAPLLAFGCLTLWVASVIAAKRVRSSTISPLWWLALTLCAGLTLAAKHTGVVFIAAAFVWIFLVEVLSRPAISIPSLLYSMGRLTLIGVGALLIFLLLSPAYWRDPVGRLGDTLRLRTRTIVAQVAGTPGAPIPFEQRVNWLITQPLMRPLDSAHDVQEGQHYGASGWSGFHWGLWGIIPTAFALVGLISAVHHVANSRRRRARAAQSLGLMIWLVAVSALALANPLPWQRYFAPVIPVVMLLAASGMVQGLSILSPMFNHRAKWQPLKPGLNDQRLKKLQ